MGGKEEKEVTTGKILASYRLRITWKGSIEFYLSTLKLDVEQIA